MDRSAYALKKLGKIRVGLIGDGGRAVAWHVAALGLLADYELVSLHSSHSSSSIGPSELLSTSASAAEVAHHPQVDLVAIVGAAPCAYDAACEAMLAGKDVYCDWPIGTIVESADAISALAQRSGVCHFVGLQLRLFPVIRYMGDLIARGHCGKISSLRVTASPPLAHTPSATPGAGKLAVAAPDNAIHFLDAAFSVTGRPKFLSGLVGSGADWERLQARLSEPAQFCMIGKLDNDAMFSVHLDTRAWHEACLMLDISGDAGKLRLSASAGEFVNASLVGRRQSNRDPVRLAVPKTYHWFFRSAMASDVIGVANLYAAFAHDLHEGTHLVPDLQDGLLMDRILNLALRSSELGHRIDLTEPSG